MRRGLIFQRVFIDGIQVPLEFVAVEDDRFGVLFCYLAQEASGEKEKEQEGQPDEREPVEWVFSIYFHGAVSMSTSLLRLLLYQLFPDWPVRD